MAVAGCVLALVGLVVALGKPAPKPAAA